jgi:hypothetical protein
MPHLKKNASVSSSEMDADHAVLFINEIVSKEGYPRQF